MMCMGDLRVKADTPTARPRVRFAKRCSREIAAALCAFLFAVAANAAELVGTPRVLDGDTLEVDGARVRLLGIDAPERGEPGAVEATSALLNIIAGREIACTDTGGRTHGRIVATCTVGKGSDLSALMVGYGWAAACAKFTPAYVGFEAAARERRAGIWRRGAAYVRQSYCLERE
jgi:endonuclease YncB( thermonuclease family)